MLMEEIRSYCVTSKDFDVAEEEESQELWDAFMNYKEIDPGLERFDDS
jgi:hypothetical protein